MSLLPLDPRRRETLRDLLPDGPGPTFGRHVLNTGYGACWADRWPQPRAVLFQTADNYALSGDPQAVSPGDLERYIAGMIDAPEIFDALLSETFDDLQSWDRVILERRQESTSVIDCSRNSVVRRLEASDAHHLFSLALDTVWIANTWGGPRGLAESELAWGAFVGDRLVSVAAPFLVSDGYEDLGVATEEGFRGRGLSPACAARVLRDTFERGRRASWSTSPDNRASLRVAAKLGFTEVGRSRLLVTGMAIPDPASPDDRHLKLG